MKKCFEADLADIGKGRRPDCPAAYIEARAPYLAQQGDLICGRTAPWRDAIMRIGGRPVDVPGLEFYYLTHALLVLASRYGQDEVPAIKQLIQYARTVRHPHFRVYVLDDEMSILLLWIKRISGASNLTVEANGVEITNRWNQKISLHPLISEATGLAVSVSDSPHSTLRLETELTPLARELGFTLSRLPGYSIPAGSPDAFRQDLHAAARLLQERYGITRGCLKAARAGTGARILTNIPLTDVAHLDGVADNASRTSEDYVLEAQVDYLSASAGQTSLILAPSVHVVDGLLAEEATLQFLLGPVWHGNLYVDRNSCASLGLPVEQYDQIRKEMREFIDAMQERGSAAALTKGGVDFAVGRVGGAFGADVLVGMQDLNLSSHGAEYLRAFLRRLADAPQKGGGPRLSAATLVVRPNYRADMAALQDAILQETVAPWRMDVVACVPGRWGMIAAAAPSPGEAADDIFQIEDNLVVRGL